MFEVQTQNFGVSIEVVFRRPVSFREAQPEICAEKLVALLQTWNLKATRLTLEKRDLLYSYEFNFAVYGDNVKILLNSERLNFSFANGRTQIDFQAIANGVSKFSECFPLPADANITANLYAHSSFDSSAKYKEYISRFRAKDVNVEFSGTIAYVKTKNWTEPIRFLIDRSEMFPSSLFLYWVTKLTNWPVTVETIDSINKAADESREIFQLKFLPLITG